MQTNFNASLDRVLVHEGGWSDNPKDPGGATMKGVTLQTFRRYYGSNQSKQNLRNISTEQLGHIYRKGFWNVCYCDQLPAGLDYCVFDAAVNSGPGNSIKWLQAAVGSPQDGGMGPNTLAKVKAHGDVVALINKTCDRRLGFLKSLKTWSTFGKGWGSRVEGVRTAALNMASGQSSSPAAATSSTNYETVRLGSSGPWVRKLQDALKLSVDGKFGAGTEAALKAWQKEHNLEADGVAGRGTYRALGLLS